MKSVLLALTLTLALTPCEALAQPTITMCNRTFINAEFINYHSIQYDTFGVTAGVGGANAVWDYSNLTTQSSMANFEGFYYPQNTPYGFFFLFANIASNFDLNYSFKYYAYLPNAITYYGFHYSQQDCNKYSDPALEVVCPMNFMDAFYDTYGGRNCQNVYFSGARSVSYDGFGTLMLPSMTVQNVVRLHTLDTMTIAGIAHYRETYSWYETWRYLPHFTIVRERIAGTSNSTFTATRYDLFNMNSTAEGIGAESGIVLFPNPVHDFLTVTTPANLKARHFVIADVAGRELRRFSLDGVRTAGSMEGLTAGNYLFRVLDFKGNLVDSGTLVKE